MKKKRKEEKNSYGSLILLHVLDWTTCLPLFTTRCEGSGGAVTYEEMVVQGGLPSDTDKNVWGQTVSQWPACESDAKLSVFRLLLPSCYYKALMHVKQIHLLEDNPRLITLTTSIRGIIWIRSDIQIIHELLRVNSTLKYAPLPPLSQYLFRYGPVSHSQTPSRGKFTGPPFL